MSNRFSQVPKADISRSSFDRSHGHKTTMDGGWLYPIYIDEGLPGDTFNLKMHAIARLSTPIFPIMDNIYIDTQFFAVPARLVWDNWERFNGAQDSPNASVDYVIPQLEGSINAGSLGDYFGLPYASDFSVNALPFRCYDLIWNEWYRDQNLQAEIAIYKGDAPRPLPAMGLHKRGKRHDYFTSCLPWPQKGPGADVSIAGGGIPTFSTVLQPTLDTALQTNSDTTVFTSKMPGSATESDMVWSDPALSFTINTLRQATQIQKILERDARGGTRYVELLKAHFNVTSPDYRFQRPEYLGGYSQPINIAQIHQTQSTQAGSTPLGQVGAIGTAMLDGGRNGFTASFTEHVYIIGLCSIRSDMTYQNKLEKLWSRRTRFDFFWPALAHIGEQAVLNQEIFWSEDLPADNEKVFGYQERFAEYRYRPSQVTGKFRSTDPQSLDAWHLAFDWTTHPALNSSFIEEDPPFDRVVAVPSEPKVIMDAWFDLTCARPMPMFGVPGLMDHF